MNQLQLCDRTTRQWDEQGEHDNDLRYESMVDYESWLTDANQYDEREQE